MPPLLAELTLYAIAFAGPPAAEPTPARVRAAVERALPPLLDGAAGYTARRQCFSCHNQAVPVLALQLARARGFDVSRKSIQDQLRFTAASLARNRDDYRQGKGQGGQADTAGYALFALDVGGHKPDATTAAVAEYLLRRDGALAYWKTVSRRPPSEASPVTTTYLALRGLGRYATAEQKDRVAARVTKARGWLLAVRPNDTEDRVFRLRGLRQAGASPRDLQAAARDLLRTQRPDGGWAQTDALPSDAYATGSALVALHEDADLAVTDTAYQRGLKFLIHTQLADGTWHVRTRSKPFQLYFESGFPHGKDQFISIAASGWATAALALACDDRSKRGAARAGETAATKPAAPAR